MRTRRSSICSRRDGIFRHLPPDTIGKFLRRVNGQKTDKDGRKVGCKKDAECAYRIRNGELPISDIMLVHIYI